ncbi:MAG: beta-ketoacyl-ACP synthase, partial [Flavobacteriaceae bacterium]
MAREPREVWITGIGVASSLGDGLDAHRAALGDASGAFPRLDRETYAPYAIHPMAEIDLSTQIPRRGDQRQMEPWQRYGVYAAGLALDHAGLKGNEELLGATDMIVAAGGGERDVAVDEAIMQMLRDGAPLDDPRIVERLANDLRPTLFLAQLPNLLAGNISIVHGVTGSSRTFMGEEAAGADAARIARARIAAGQGEICLVGGSYSAARWEMLLLLGFGDTLLRGDWRPVWERGAEGGEKSGGMVTGSMGAFLVLESAEHATRRGATPVARLSGVESDRCLRAPGEASANARRQWEALRPLVGDAPLAVISGASGCGPATAEERSFLESVAAGTDMAVRAAGALAGHGREAQFILNLARAAMGVRDGSLFPARDASGGVGA